MTVQRFRTDDERNRQGFGWFFMMVAAALIAGLVWLDVRAGRVTVTALVLFAVLAGLFALGYRLAFKRREYFDIDVAQRTYALTREGSPRAQVPSTTSAPWR